MGKFTPKQQVPSLPEPASVPVKENDAEVKQAKEDTKTASRLRVGLGSTDNTSGTGTASGDPTTNRKALLGSA